MSITTILAPRGDLNDEKPHVSHRFTNVISIKSHLVLPDISNSILPVVLPPIPEIRQRVRPKPRATRKLMNGKVPFVEGDDEENPFTIPPDLQEYMDKDQIEKEERGLADKSTKTVDKQTNAMKNTRRALNRVKPFSTPQFKQTQASVFKQITWKAQTGLHINHLQKVSRKIHSDYLTNRKTVYYLHRAIRTRKQALDLLKQRRLDEEAALKNYEWLTDYTQESFDAFLKENDDDTIEASKAAEAALKEKLEKTSEVRDLNIKINHLKSEILSANESLRECKVYMSFLDEISREGMRKDEEEANRAYRRKQQMKEEIVKLTRQGIPLKQAQEMVAANEAKFDDRRNDLSGKMKPGERSSSLELVTDLNNQLRLAIDKHLEATGNNDGNNDAESQNFYQAISSDQVFQVHGQLATGGRTEGRGVPILPPNAGKVQFVGKPKNIVHEDGYDEESLLLSLELVPGTEEDDMNELANLSFTRPSQLLQIYSDMEEQNLSLIQHSQASEEVLDQVNVQIRKARKTLNEKSRRLRKEINNMEDDINYNEERGHALRQLVDMFTGGNYDVRQQQKLFRILRRHVGKVYKAAVGNIDHHLSPLLMLTSVEKNFEDLVKEIQAMPDDIIFQISRELDKERREVERSEKLSRKKEAEDVRALKNLERARAPIRIKKGRPLYPRSRPPRPTIKLSQAELEKKAEQDEFNYFFGP